MTMKTLTPNILESMKIVVLYNDGEYFKQRYSIGSNNILTKYPRPSGIPLHSFKKFSHIWV